MHSLSFIDNNNIDTFNLGNASYLAMDTSPEARAARRRKLRYQGIRDAWRRLCRWFERNTELLVLLLRLLFLILRLIGFMVRGRPLTSAGRLPRARVHSRRR